MFNYFSPVINRTSVLGYFLQVPSRYYTLFTFNRENKQSCNSFHFSAKSYCSYNSYTILLFLLTRCPLFPTLYLLSFISSTIQTHLVLLYYCHKSLTFYIFSYTINNKPLALLYSFPIPRTQ